MPQIMVIADRPGDGDEAPVMLRERVNISDFDSAHFAAQLVERLGWAVGDAHELQARRPEPECSEDHQAFPREHDLEVADGGAFVEQIAESALTNDRDYAPASVLTTAS